MYHGWFAWDFGKASTTLRETTIAFYRKTHAKAHLRGCQRCAAAAANDGNDRTNLRYILEKCPWDESDKCDDEVAYYLYYLI